MIQTQHDDAYRLEKSDFAHFQISLAARLAYQIDIDTNETMNLANTNERLSYLAGWLGDATLDSGKGISFRNDDYKADLDAENVFRILSSSPGSYINAMNSYYLELYDKQQSRANIFTSHISYENVRNMIYAELNISPLLSDENKLNCIQEIAPDTYDFLLGIRDGSHELQE